MATFPRINGKLYDFSSAEISIADRIFNAFDSVSYDQPIEEGIVRGSAAEPLGRTRGELQIGEGSITIVKEEGQEIWTLLGNGYLETEFSITCVYSATNAPTTRDELFGCRFLSQSDDHSSGSDALVVEMEFSFLNMKRNGLTPLLNQRI